jgi:hypothetical protein
MFYSCARGVGGVTVDLLLAVLVTIKHSNKGICINLQNARNVLQFSTFTTTHCQTLD